VKSTARGCNVSGTGHHGIEIRAESATKALKTTTTTISKSHERERGNKTSTSVARGWVASEDMFLLCRYWLLCPQRFSLAHYRKAVPIWLDEILARVHGVLALHENIRDGTPSSSILS
jgi:hypothetical protein